MTLKFHTIKSPAGSRKAKKRVGRGNASGHGTYSGKGQKGQRARSGGRSGLKLKGLKQNLLNIPKLRGFKSRHAKMTPVNLDILDKKYQDGERVNPQTLIQKGIVKKIERGIKILGSGEISKKIIVESCQMSAAAKEKIAKAGGKVLELKQDAKSIEKAAKRSKEKSE